MSTELDGFGLRAVEMISDRVAIPAGRVVGRMLGRVRYRGECSDLLFPVADFTDAVSHGIKEGYTAKFKG